MTKFERKIREGLLMGFKNAYNLKETKTNLPFEQRMDNPKKTIKNFRIRIGLVLAIGLIMLMLPFAYDFFTSIPTQDPQLINIHAYDLCYVELVNVDEELYYRDSTQYKIITVEIKEIYLKNKVDFNGFVFYPNDQFKVALPKDLWDRYDAINHFIINGKDGYQWLKDKNSLEIGLEKFNLFIKYNPLQNQFYENILIPVEDNIIKYDFLIDQGISSDLIDSLFYANDLFGSIIFKSGISIIEFKDYIEAVEEKVDIILEEDRNNDYVAPDFFTSIIFIYITIIIIGIILKGILNIRRDRYNKHD